MAHLTSAVAPLLLSVALLSSIASCSSAPASDPPTQAAAAGLREAARASVCPATSGYLVLGTADSDLDPTCGPIFGWGGTWVESSGASPGDCLPAPDSASAEATLCSYEWSADDAASPDVSALLSLSGVYVAAMGPTGNAACDRQAALRYVTLQSSAGVKCRPGRGSPDAPHFCDVCGSGIRPGVVADSLRLPSSTPLRTMTVGLSNGATQVLSLDGEPASGASGDVYLDLPLPPPPPGVDYVDGPALGYGYTTAGAP